MAVLLQGVTLGQFLTTTGHFLNPTRTVVCNFKVENYTNTTLIHEKCEIGHGEIPRAPENIEPGVKMQFGSQKGDWTWYGVAAMCTWRFKDRLIFLYWHVPLSAAGGYNMIFIGITHPGVTHSQLSYNSVGDVDRYPERIALPPVSSLFKSFAYDVFENSTRWIEIEDRDIKVRATMGTNKQCEATVHIIPHQNEDFAPELRRRVGLN